MNYNYRLDQSSLSFLKTHCKNEINVSTNFMLYTKHHKSSNFSRIVVAVKEFQLIFFVIGKFFVVFKFYLQLNIKNKK